MMPHSLLATHLQRLLVVVKHSTDPDGAYTQRVCDCLQSHGKQVHVVRADFDTLDATLAQHRQHPPDFVIVIGGDGTFLRTAQYFAPCTIPMVGINRGHLGFLTRIETNSLEAYLQKLLAGEFHLEHRIMLAVLPPVTHTVVHRMAINDVVIKTASPSQMARMRLFLDEFHVADYDADGLIIATPTGSTAYNLAAGGPILSPNIGAMSITPICPHSFTAKPVVIPDTYTLRIECSEKNSHPIVYTLDGHPPTELQKGESLTITKAEHCLTLVDFEQPEDNFYWLLRQKLHWGNTPRKTGV
ncbi:MAG: NAD(+)/NADH kinase [Vampirovibrionales bacterium]